MIFPLVFRFEDNELRLYFQVKAHSMLKIYLQIYVPLKSEPAMAILDDLSQSEASNHDITAVVLVYQVCIVVCQTRTVISSLAESHALIVKQMWLRKNRRLHFMEGIISLRFVR